MKVRNMRGPRTVPWGTPESNAHPFGTFAIHNHSLSSLCQKSFSPGMHVASDPIPPQLPHQSLVRHFVEGFGEV